MIISGMVKICSVLEAGSVLVAGTRERIPIEYKPVPQLVLDSRSGRSFHNTILYLEVNPASTALYSTRKWIQLPQHCTVLGSGSSFHNIIQYSQVDPSSIGSSFHSTVLYPDQGSYIYFCICYLLP
jgi:hypothetical protein